MIELKGLTKQFGKNTVLDHISFSIGKGSIFGLVGSNGAGKSTLLRIFSGIYQADDGAVLIDGKTPFENASTKARLFFISDYPYFLPQSSLEDMAKFYAMCYPNWNPERYRQLCSIFPLNPKARLINMSKGMQRQAALICALSTCPDYLFLDEIFDGLDPVIRQLLKKLLSGDVADRGMTVVIASHNLRELEDLCDHVGLLHRGGIVFERELDSLQLGICKIQAIFKPMLPPEAFDAFSIIHQDIRGSVINLTVRGGVEETLEKVNALNPVFCEVLPLTLEEVFICEMEVAGYDFNNILP